MKKIEAIVRPERMDIVKERLRQMGIGGMTVSTVSGWSKEREFHLQWRGQPIAFDLLPKSKLEIVVPDSKLDYVIQSITETAKTGEGQHGDGVIFVSTIDQAIKIATSEKGENVIL